LRETKNADFRLFDKTRPYGRGNVFNGGFTLRKTRKHYKTAFRWLKTAFQSYLVFLKRRKDLMNKRIVAISVLLLMMCAMAASVFAGDTEYEYKVTVYYNVKNPRTLLIEQKSKEYTIWASSAREAEAEAQRLCEYDFGEVASCGGARATGRSKS